MTEETNITQHHDGNNHDDDKEIPHSRPARPLRIRGIYQDKRFNATGVQKLLLN